MSQLTAASTSFLQRSLKLTIFHNSSLSLYSFPNSRSFPTTATTTTIHIWVLIYICKVFQNIPETYNITILVVSQINNKTEQNVL